MQIWDLENNLFKSSFSHWVYTYVRSTTLGINTSMRIPIVYFTKSSHNFMTAKQYLGFPFYINSKMSLKVALAILKKISCMS